MTFRKVPIGAYVSRDDKFAEICRGKRVLHLGCVGFTDCDLAEKVRLARASMHSRLSEISDCVGVDLDRDTIAELRRHGVFENVLPGDVERLEDLPPNLKKFDVVVAGDIIEHLSNPGRMLDGVRGLLKPGGVFVVSTPNAFGLPSFLRHAAGRFHEGLQHVLNFNAITLTQLLERHRYTVVEALSCHQGTAARQHGVLFSIGRGFFQLAPQYGGTLLFVTQPQTT
jgi:SAM-dependent methyltransferase